MTSENMKLFVLWRESILDGVEPADIEGGWASLFKKLAGESSWCKREILGSLYFVVQYITAKMGATIINATWYSEPKSVILSRYFRLMERIQHDTLAFQAKEMVQVCMYRRAMSLVASLGMGTEKGTPYAELEARALESDKVFAVLMRA